MRSTNIRARLCLLAILATAAAAPMREAHAQPPAAGAIDAVVVHPFIRAYYTCGEHYEGQLKYAFDALGSDCFIVENGRTYRTTGETNEDYYIWGHPVLAPFDAVVESVTINPVINRPGEMGKPPASWILFRRADGVKVMYAHLDGITVAKGDTVAAGQPVAVVSNNGVSRGPHVHIGAVDAAGRPLQIRWDLRAMAALRAPPEG